ncbi:13966_t:CDS:1, partial [Entrophospora sp. SA101]
RIAEMKAETTRGKFSNPKPDLVKEVMETTKEAPVVAHLS